MEIKEIVFQIAQQEKNFEFSYLLNEEEKHSVLDVLKLQRILFLIGKDDVEKLSNVLPKSRLITELMEDEERTNRRLRREHMFISKIYPVIKDAAQNPIVIVKGVSLHKIYSRYPRSSNDIDLLIHPKDYMTIHNILLSKGFTLCAYNKSAVDDSTINRMIEITSHLLTYCHKEYGYIELHQCVNNNFEVEKMFFNCIEENGINILSDIDSFLYICYHAWHHYPKGGFFEKETKLRLYVDVHEYYLYLESLKLTHLIYKRAVEVGLLDIVQHMICATERIFGNFCFETGLKKINTSYSHDWKCNTYTSYLEDRICDFSSEINRLMPVIVEAQKNRAIDVQNTLTPVLMYEMQSNKTYPDNIFHSYCYYAELIENTEVTVRWGVACNSGNIVIITEYTSDNLSLNNKDEFFVGASNCVFRMINCTTGKRIQIIMQPTVNGNVLACGESTGGYFEYFPIEVGQSHILKKEDNIIGFITELPLSNWNISESELKRDVWRGDFVFSYLKFNPIYESLQMSWGLGALEGAKSIENFSDAYPLLRFN